MTSEDAAGIVTRDVHQTGGGVLMRVGVVSENGAVVLITGAPRTVLNDPATAAELRQALEWAATEQHRIHRELYPAPEPSDAVMADALAAYAGVMADNRYKPPAPKPAWDEEDRERYRLALSVWQNNAMAAALTAAGIYKPRLLRTALRAYRADPGDREVTPRRTDPADHEAALRRALSAVLQAAT